MGNLFKANDSKTQRLMQLAMPIVLSLLLQFTYNTIDLFWVGKLGSQAVASVGSAVFFIHLAYSIFSMVTIGASVKIAHSVGAKDIITTKNYISAALVLGAITGGLCTVALLLFPEACISILNIDDATVNQIAVKYLKINAIGIILAFVNQLFTAILNAHGLTKISFRSVLLGNIANIILDPIFIFGLGWGVEGAAWATVVSWVISLVYFIIVIKKQNLLSFNIEAFQRKIYSSLLLVGSAGAIRHILFTIIAIAIGTIIARFGPEAIAAQKIGLQIESLSFMILIGLSQGLGIMVGHAFGAKKYQDISHLYRIAIKMGGIIAILTTLLFVLLPETLTSLFVSDPFTIEIGVNYLIIVGISQLFMMIELITGGAFNGQGLTHYTAAISIIFTALRIPLAIYLCSTPLGLSGVWWSISLTSIIKGLVSYFIFQYKYKQLVAA